MVDADSDVVIVRKALLTNLELTTNLVEVPVRVIVKGREAFERILAAPDARIETVEQLEALSGALEDALSIVSGLLGREAPVEPVATVLAPPGRKEDASSHFEDRKAERERMKLEGFPG